MSRPTRIEIDCTTGIETIIELTDAEIAKIEADAVQAEAERAAFEAEAKAKADARASALAKIAEMTGLTEEEIAAL
jgi:hypothetical protein